MNDIIEKFKNYIAEKGGAYSDWYIGITSDIETRLFNAHNVNEQNDIWIYDNANTETSARSIEEYFVETLGTDGGTGGGDNTSIFVYAYKKNPHTNENN